jgi:hypothetical protein
MEVAYESRAAFPLVIPFHALSGMRGSHAQDGAQAVAILLLRRMRSPVLRSGLEMSQSNGHLMIDNALLRKKFIDLRDHNEVTAADIAHRLGWQKMTDGAADITRVHRALGMANDTKIHRTRQSVSEETAKQLCEAMHILPAEVGF